MANGGEGLGADRLATTRVAEPTSDAAFTYVALAGAGLAAVAGAGPEAVLPLDGQGRHGAGVRTVGEADALHPLQGLDLGRRSGGPIVADAPPLTTGTAVVVLAGEGGPSGAAFLAIDVGAAALEGAQCREQVRLGPA